MKAIKYFIVIIVLLFCSYNAQSTTLYDHAKSLLDNQSPGDTIRFAVLSDTHYDWDEDPEGNKNDIMITAIFNTLANRTPKPDFIIICGDAYDWSYDMQKFYNFIMYDDTAGMLNHEIPVFLVPGNHEFKYNHPNCDYMYDYLEFINPFWDSSLTGIGAETAWDYYIDYDSSRFIITNNVNHPYDTTKCKEDFYRITNSSLANIATLLDDSEHENKFCFGHVPLFFEPMYYNYAYRDTLYKYGAKANFSGHTHTYFRYIEPGFLDITIGQSGTKDPYFDSSKISPPVENDLPNWVMVTIIKKAGDDEINMELNEVETVEPYSSILQPAYLSYAPLIRNLENEPNQQQFVIGSTFDTTLINSEHPDFDIEGMVFGWHWGGNLDLTRAMNMNQIHYSDGTIDLDEIPDSSYVVRGTSGIWAANSNEDNVMPTSAPGNAFTIGCASTGGTWGSGWIALDKNLGSHFGSNAIGVGGASVEFSADVLQGSVPATGIACNTFAASGWTKHLIQSNLVSFQLAGQSESNPACLTIDTTQHPRSCLDSLINIGVKCIGKNAAGNYEYTVQISAMSCAPSTVFLSSPDGPFSPNSFNVVSSPWNINSTFTHTSANNPITIYFTILCNGVECRDSIKRDLPDCPPVEPKDCCSKFMRKIEKPQIAWSSDGSVSLSTSMFAGPAGIKKFTATIVSAQLRFQMTPWQRIFGDILGGNVVVAPSSGPQLLSLFSREAIWGPGECKDWNNGANLSLKMLFPSVGSKAGTDSLRFAIRYSFTDCDCVTCDTVIFYTIVRKWKPIPWDSDIFKRNGMKGKDDKSEKTNGETPSSTGIIMEQPDSGSLWVISPDDAENDVTIRGIEVNSQQVSLSEIKFGNNVGKITDNTAFVKAEINSGDNVSIALMFENSEQLMQFPVYVRYIYTISGYEDTLTTEPILYIARAPGAVSDEMGVDNSSQPTNVASYALYITNSNGYYDGIHSISIKPSANMKLLAVGPPSSENGVTYLIPQMLADGSFIFTVPSQGIAGLESMKTAKPIFLTLSGVEETNAEIEFITFDINMQKISEGKLTLSDPISAVEDDDRTTHTGMLLNPISPNPAKNFVTISFTFNDLSNDAKLSIVDLNGKELIKVIDGETLNKGTYIRGVDISYLPSGAYYIVLRQQNGVTTKPLSIVR
ncbi:MAG: metallophosphoesterase [bacterium]